MINQGIVLRALANCSRKRVGEKNSGATVRKNVISSFDVKEEGEKQTGVS